jgi:hypothetical protein
MDKMVKEAKAIPSGHYLVQPGVSLNKDTKASAGLSTDDLDKIKNEAVRKAKKLAAEKKDEIDDLMNEIIYA